MVWYPIYFGKLHETETPGAPILPGFEHQILGAHEKVPDFVLAECDPARTGIGSGELDAWENYPWKDTPGGLIGKPLLHGQEVWWITGRIGCRREQGENSRYYTHGTYLATPAQNLGLAPLTGMPALLMPRILAQRPEKPEQILAVDGDPLLPSDYADSLLPLLERLLAGERIHINDSEQDPDQFFAWALQVMECLPDALSWRLSIGSGLYHPEQVQIAHGFHTHISGPVDEAAERAAQACILWYEDLFAHVLSRSEFKSSLHDQLLAMGLPELTGWNGLPLQWSWDQALGYFRDRLAEYIEVESLVLGLLNGDPQDLARLGDIKYFGGYLLEQLWDIPDFPNGPRVQALLPALAHPSWKAAWQGLLEEAHNNEPPLFEALGALLGNFALRPELLSDLPALDVPEALSAQIERNLVPWLATSLRGEPDQKTQACWQTFLHPPHRPTWLASLKAMQPDLFTWLEFHHLLLNSQEIDAAKAQQLQQVSESSELSQVLAGLITGQSLKTNQLNRFSEQLSRYTIHRKSLTYLLNAAKNARQPRETLWLFLLCQAKAPDTLFQVPAFQSGKLSYEVVEWLLKLQTETALQLPELGIGELEQLEKLLALLGRDYAQVTPRLKTPPRSPNQVHTYVCSIPDKEALTNAVNENVILSSLKLQLDASKEAESLRQFWSQQEKRVEHFREAPWLLFSTNTRLPLHPDQIHLIHRLDSVRLSRYIRDQHPVSIQLLDSLDPHDLFRPESSGKKSADAIQFEILELGRLVELASAMMASGLARKLVKYIVKVYTKPNFPGLKINDLKSNKSLPLDTSAGKALSYLKVAVKAAGLDDSSLQQEINLTLNIKSKKHTKPALVLLGSIAALIALFSYMTRYQEPRYEALGNKEIATRAITRLDLQKYFKEPKVTASLSRSRLARYIASLNQTQNMDPREPNWVYRLPKQAELEQAAKAQLLSSERKSFTELVCEATCDGKKGAYFWITNWDRKTLRIANSSALESAFESDQGFRLIRELPEGQN